MDVTSPTMPYSEEDKYIIKHYRERYGWGSLKIFNELGQDPGKNWTRDGISYLIKIVEELRVKFGQTGTKLKDKRVWYRWKRNLM